MTETFINEIKAGLFEFMADDDIDAAIRVISRVASRYRIEPASEELTVWQPTLPEAYKAFIVTRKIEGLSNNTINLYRGHLEHFFAHVQKPIRKITTNDIRVYLYRVQDERHMSNRSLDTRRSSISAFFSWATANEYIDRNPCASVKPIKYERKEREPLNGTELERVRSACQTVRERAIVEILYSTACRVSELTGLKLDDVDLNTGECKLLGKGNKHRSSWMSESAMLYLSKYLAERNDSNSSVIVSDRSPHNSMTASGIERIIRDIGVRSGIDRLHPHLFRHSSATNLLQRGMDVTQLQQLLGHNSVDTTMIYAKVDKSAVRENHRRFIN